MKIKWIHIDIVCLITSLLVMYGLVFCGDSYVIQQMDAYTYGITAVISLTIFANCGYEIISYLDPEEEV